MRIQPSVIALMNNKNVNPDDFELGQAFNNYFKSAEVKLGRK